MTLPEQLLEDTAEELFEDAPCGYLSTRVDGTIVKVNRTFEAWTGLARDDLLGRRRFQDLLAVGGRIYYETHLAPLLMMQGSVREIAVEVVRADGSKLPALINSVVRTDDAGSPRVIRTTVFDATDRRRYEEELLRARRREQEIAQHLQRSLLSGALPAGDGLALEVAYRSAVSGLEVGGDWYDAFRLDDAAIGLVVGDVVGRGIAAAATMGQLRSAVRALAATGLGPARLLEALDGYSHRHDVGQMTTLAYGRLELGSGELTYACAGHPPPIVVRPGRPPELLWDGRSLPLDAGGADAGPRDEGRCRLDPGTLLLLYTDGLVERRRQPLEEGMDLLLGQVDAHRHDDLRGMADLLIRTMADPQHPDDLCLLAMRLTGAADG